MFNKRKKNIPPKNDQKLSFVVSKPIEMFTKLWFVLIFFPAGYFFSRRHLHNGISTHKTKVRAITC